MPPYGHGLDLVWGVNLLRLMASRTACKVRHYESLCVYCQWPRRLQKLQKGSILMSAFVLNLISGSFYTYGNIQPYYVSYIRERSTPSSLRYTQSAYVYSCLFASFTVGLMTACFIERKIGPRVAVLIGGGMVVSGQCITFIAIRYSFWLLMVTYGILYGFGVGVIFVSSVVCVLRWFPNKWSGLASGFAISGNGVGSVAFNIFQTVYINPSNELPQDIPYTVDHPDEKYFSGESQSEILTRVPVLFLIQGLVFLIMVCVTSIFMVNPSPVFKRSTSVSLQHPEPPTPSQALTVDLKPCQMITKINFHLIWLMNVFVTIMNGIIFAQYKAYGLEVVQTSDYFLTLTGIVGGLATTITQISLGMLADKVNHKFAFVLNNSLLAVFLLTLYTTSLQLHIMYLIWICVIFSCYGGHLTLLAVALLKEFGKKHLNTNYALLYTSLIAGSLIAGVISDYCIDLFNWYGTFLLLGIMSILQLLLSLLIRKQIAGAPTKLNLYNTILMQTQQFD